jgi:hypothetical protein
LFVEVVEAVFGWRRHSVELGLHERRSGIICLGAQEAFCGNKLWEEKHPEVAEALWSLAKIHSQQDPTFRTTLSYTRLTAAEALKQLQELGFGPKFCRLPARWRTSSIAMATGYGRYSKPSPKKNSRDRRHLRQSP